MDPAASLSGLLAVVALVGTACPARAPEADAGARPSAPAASRPAAAAPAAPAPSASDASVVALDAYLGPPPATPPRTSTTTVMLRGRRALGEALSKLQPVIRAGASDAGSAWALGHGLVAFGPELRASDGRLAIDVMVSDFAVPGTFPPVFPATSKAGLPVEPHPRLIVKSLLEAGVPLDRRFTLPGGKPRTLAAIAHATLDPLVAPTTDGEWRQFAWSLSAIFSLASAEHPKALPPALRTRLEGLFTAALARLEAEDDFLQAAMIAGRPDAVEKRKQKIFAHPCGGLHLIQAVVQGAALVGTPQQKARVAQQLDVLRFRHQVERRIYRETIQKNPDYALLIHVQALKFHGHVLETLGFAQRYGMLHDTPTLRETLDAVLADLDAAVEALVPAYERQHELRQRSLQTYLDLIGDGCHAVRGLRMALVAWFAP